MFKLYVFEVAELNKKVYYNNTNVILLNTFKLIMGYDLIFCYFN